MFSDKENIGQPHKKMIGLVHKADDNTIHLTIVCIRDWLNVFNLIIL